jgi:septal ring factor EnvC (AmiA/AmiB activator)
MNTSVKSFSREIRRCNRELSELKNQLAHLSNEMHAIVEILEQHRVTLSAYDRRIEMLDQTVWDILNSRVWKSLEMIGSLPRKLFRRT